MQNITANQSQLYTTTVEDSPVLGSVPGRSTAEWHHSRNIFVMCRLDRNLATGSVSVCLSVTMVMYQNYWP